MQNGKPVYRQVQTGMATSSYTEITSGLTAGETVVTGQYTDGATTATGRHSTTRSRAALGGLFPGGGGFPGGGPACGCPPGGGQ